MTTPVPIVLVPGLGCSARLYAEQIPLLWRYGPVLIADHRQDDTVAAIAHRILAAAPPVFALVGLSLGGYIAFAVLRQAPERVLRLALLDTSARPDRPEQREVRESQIAMAQTGRMAALTDMQYDRMVHGSFLADPRLRQVMHAMSDENGVDAFVRQQRAIMARPDSRPDLASIECPTLVLVGEADTLTPPELAQEMANGIHGAHLIVVPACGHLATIERPEAVNAALADWMAR
jgi:pimeloyl-ACP methyl ester carboxylesterase